MTDRECADVDGDWLLYADAGGCMPLAAGVTIDTRGQERTFAITFALGGAYQHQLLEREMASHSDVLPQDGSGRGDRKTLYDTPNADERAPDGSHATESAGGNQSHSNLPPHIVLNFCQHQ